jgi:hypothetical protein
LNIQTINDLITLLDRGVDESLQLEFKSSASLARDSKIEREMCKDVSAFANSAGGLIIYGVREDKNRKSFELDEGVTDEKINVEWIQQKLNSYVHPKIEGIRVWSLRLTSGGAVYLIDVPATTTGPHQAPDRRYYKRYNKLSEPMEDYEIRDVMGRSNAPILSLYVAAHKAMKAIQYANSFDVPMSARILNRSSTPALYATFSLFIDTRLTIIDSGDTMRGEVINISGQPVTHIYRNFAPPNDFPFFKETRVMPTRFRVAAPTPATQDSFALIGEVACPGFTRRFNGKITIDLLGTVDLDWPERMLN